MAAIALLSGCSSGQGGASDAGATFDAKDAVGVPDGAFGDGACGRCIASACSAPLTDCASDPDCAAYWSCVQRCGVGSKGDVDPACEAACPSGTSSAGAQAELELTHCRADGAGAFCVACGTEATKEESPILKQRCSGELLPDAAPDACDACDAKHCCETEAACGADCKSYITCMETKQDFDLCSSEYPEGLLAGEQEHACLLIECYTEGLCGVQNVLLQCILQECGNEYATLAATVDGASYWECLLFTFDAPECLSLYPAVAVLGDAVNTCISDSCQLTLDGD